MAITIPVNISTPIGGGINLDALKEELTRYAATLVSAMSKQDATTSSQVVHRTSPFVESLIMKGGQPVPNNIKMEELYAE